MSYCTIIILKTSELELIKKEILQNYNLFSREFMFSTAEDNDDRKSLKNISELYSSFSLYTIVCIDSMSTVLNNNAQNWKYQKLEKKIEKFRKQGWSDNKIEEYREKESQKIDASLLSYEERKKNLETVLFGLANKYFIAFAYYWQGRDQNGNEWSGFKEMKKIVESQQYYEENIVYMIDEKVYKKLLNAVSYSLGNL